MLNKTLILVNIFNFASVKWLEKDQALHENTLKYY